MKARHILGVAGLAALLAGAAFAQRVLIADPTVTTAETKMTSAEKAVFDRDAVPGVRAAISKETCEEAVEVAGVAHGAFSVAAAKQSLVFYQFCQTGNGFGHVGLVLIENGKVIGNFISEAGWSIGLGVVADVNRNGTDEFTLHYSGGMHQGESGIGVDLFEFVKGTPTGIGWFKTEAIMPDQPAIAWKVTAFPGKTPVFYHSKYRATGKNGWREIGRASRFPLEKPYSKFTAVK